MTPKYQFNASAILKERNIEEETLNQFKKWCIEQKLPHLSEEQIVLFLSSANNIEHAQNTILKHFKCKSKAPELFSNLDMESVDIQEAMTVYDVAVIPRRTPDNVIVACGKLKNTSYSSFHLDDLFKLSFMALECCLCDGPVDGIIVLIDMKGFGVLHLTKLRLNILQKVFQFIQEGIPCNIKEIHILNTVNFIDKILLIIKPFISKELYQVIKFHPTGLDSEKIFGNLPKSCLPKDYGGSLATHSVLTQETYSKMLKLNMFYAELEDQIRCYEEIKCT